MLRKRKHFRFLITFAWSLMDSKGFAVGEHIATRIWKSGSSRFPVSDQDFATCNEEIMNAIKEKYAGLGHPNVEVVANVIGIQRLS